MSKRKRNKQGEFTLVLNSAQRDAGGSNTDFSITLGNSDIHNHVVASSVRRIAIPNSFCNTLIGLNTFNIEVVTEPLLDTISALGPQDALYGTMSPVEGVLTGAGKILQTWFQIESEIKITRLKILQAATASPNIIEADFRLQIASIDDYGIEDGQYEIIGYSNQTPDEDGYLTVDSSDGTWVLGGAQATDVLPPGKYAMFQTSTLNADFATHLAASTNPLTSAPEVTPLGTRQSNSTIPGLVPFGYIENGFNELTLSIPSSSSGQTTYTISIPSQFYPSINFVNSELRLALSNLPPALAAEVSLDAFLDTGTLKTTFLGTAFGSAAIAGGLTITSPTQGQPGDLLTSILGFPPIVDLLSTQGPSGGNVLFNSDDSEKGNLLYPFIEQWPMVFNFDFADANAVAETDTVVVPITIEPGCYDKGDIRSLVNQQFGALTLPYDFRLSYEEGTGGHDYAFLTVENLPNDVQIFYSSPTPDEDGDLLTDMLGIPNRTSGTEQLVSGVYSHIEKSPINIDWIKLVYVASDALTEGNSHGYGALTTNHHRPQGNLLEIISMQESAVNGVPKNEPNAINIWRPESPDVNLNRYQSSIRNRIDIKLTTSNGRVLKLYKGKRVVVVVRMFYEID